MLRYLQLEFDGVFIMHWGIRGVLVSILFSHAIFAQELQDQTTMQLKQDTEQKPFVWQDKAKELPQMVFDLSVDIFKDALAIHYNLLTWDSLKILGVFTPIYLASYVTDKRIHRQFYNPEKHKNINQIPLGVSGTIRSLTFASAMVLSSLAIVSPDPVLREVSRVFSIGYFSGIFAKNMIKKVKMDPALRPWNEKFSAERQAYGGFPSGHMFEASYMTLVYGLQYGLWALVPMGAYTASLFAASVISNRHFMSQAIAGLALGTVYGFAAHKVIQKNLSDKFSLDFGANDKGDPAMTFSYRF